jgi:hypothetical protein
VRSEELEIFSVVETENLKNISNLFFKNISQKV